MQSYVMRSDDLAPILAAQPGPGLTMKQGQVLAWNTTTGANTIDISGTAFTNVPVIGQANIATMAVNDQVICLVAGRAVYVLGKLIKI